jgi:RNA polymerase sigma-70 factor, ECF subfamily
MDQQQLENCVQGVLKKDPRSQLLLYRYCFAEMMKVALRYHSCQDDAAASFNKAMLQVFNKIDAFRKQGPFMAWVRRIVVNTCINDIRSATKFQSHEITEEQLDQFYASPDVYASIDSKLLLEMVQLLPNATRLVFNLYLLEGHTHEQIASELKISKGTSKWHLNQARTILRDRLEKIYQNETSVLQK